ncbi:histone acetyltransferase [Thoreauomyces humboldtii]|nr:histone acetyltransferase [Thoreauomyces humboldtii]
MRRKFESINVLNKLQKEWKTFEFQCMDGVSWNFDRNSAVACGYNPQNDLPWGSQFENALLIDGDLTTGAYQWVTELNDFRLDPFDVLADTSLGPQPNIATVEVLVLNWPCIFIIARESISTGAELLLDYGSYWSEFRAIERDQRFLKTFIYEKVDPLNDEIRQITCKQAILENTLRELNTILSSKTPNGIALTSALTKTMENLHSDIVAAQAVIQSLAASGGLAHTGSPLAEEQHTHQSSETDEPGSTGGPIAVRVSAEKKAEESPDPLTAGHQPLGGVKAVLPLTRKRTRGPLPEVEGPFLKRQRKAAMLAPLSEEQTLRQRDATQRICKKLLQNLSGRPAAEIFAGPIDDDEYPDYHEEIAVPMDFATARLKLDKGSYDTIEDFVDDMRLIFSNCLMVNPPGHEYNVVAQRFEWFLPKLLSEHVWFCSDCGGLLELLECTVCLHRAKRSQRTSSVSFHEVKKRFYGFRTKQKIVAKWFQNSVYYSAEIVEETPDCGLYRVAFSDGNPRELDIRDILMYPEPTPDQTLGLLPAGSKALALLPLENDESGEGGRFMPATIVSSSVTQCQVKFDCGAIRSVTVTCKRSNVISIDEGHFRRSLRQIREKAELENKTGKPGKDLLVPAVKPPDDFRAAIAGATGNIASGQVPIRLTCNDLKDVAVELMQSGGSAGAAQAKKNTSIAPADNAANLWPLNYKRAAENKVVRSESPRSDRRVTRGVSFDNAQTMKSSFGFVAAPLTAPQAIPGAHTVRLAPISKPCFSSAAVSRPRPSVGSVTSPIAPGSVSPAAAQEPIIVCIETDAARITTSGAVASTLSRQDSASSNGTCLFGAGKPANNPKVTKYQRQRSSSIIIVDDGPPVLTVGRGGKGEETIIILDD